MAKHLSEHLNSTYLNAANRLKPKQARQRIVAYVESYEDILFWRTLFDEFENERFYFEVMLPSRTNLGKGKKTVLMNRLGPQLGDNMIACVDADYDYLMQDLNSVTRQINHCKWVFHTYVYAIENFQCYAESLHSTCVMATLNDHVLIDLPEFMHTYSRIIWPLFIWSVWCYRHNQYHGFTLTDFANLVSFGDVNVRNPNSTLEAVRRRVNRKISYLQRHLPQAKADYKRLENELLRLGLTPDTTYLYMHGHSLFDNVVLPLIGPICTVLRKEREREIHALAEHNIQMQNELACYQHSQSPVDAMLRKSTGYKNSQPYEWLRMRVRELLHHLETTNPASTAEEQTKENIR